MATVQTRVSPQERAAQVRSAAAEAGATVSSRDGVVSVTILFEAGDADRAYAAWSACHRILRLVPTSRPGSTWGGDGIGFVAAVEHGCMTVHKSGANRLVCRAI